MRFVKPLDEALLLQLAREHRALVTIEENAIAGGAGSAVIEALAAAEIATPVLQIGIPDRFVEHGSREDCLRAAELDTASMQAAIERWWQRHAPAQASLRGLR
jgi:1-deoxy-D-xylulose-5-phosphate synthase